MVFSRAFCFDLIIKGDKAARDFTIFWSCGKDCIHTSKNRTSCDSLSDYSLNSIIKTGFTDFSTIFRAPSDSCFPAGRCLWNIC